MKKTFKILILVILSILFFIFGKYLGKYLFNNFDTSEIINKNNFVGREYKNNDFGFSLQMTENWKSFKVEEELMGGDFNISEIYFSLQNQKLFSISVYLKENWDDPKRDKKNDTLLGEKIAQNETYVFIYSHLNGDPPSNIPQQAIIDMDTIANSIKTFSPVNPLESPSTTNENESNLIYQDYKDQSIYYWNCKYRYSLYYPKNWKVVMADINSDKTLFQGEKINVSVEAMSSGLSLEQFATNQKDKIGGNVISSRNMSRYNKQLIAYEIDNPPTALIYWQEEDLIMEFKINGTSYGQNLSIIQNMIATLIFNQQDKNCD